ncbi:MAG: amidohydrolase [Bacteroidota bacterium]
MSKLTVTLLQTQLHWESLSENIAQFEQFFSQLEDETDLIILPEMFTTGFSMNTVDLAESMDGKSVAWMAQQSEKYDAAVVGSLIIQENDKYYNRLIFMRPDGTLDRYDKRHLFGMAGEDETYTAGMTRLQVEWRGWQICPLICYDLRFPVWSRNTSDYDLLLYIANWPMTRSFHWKSLLIARAIENQSFTIGVNCVGKDGNGYLYSGDSTIISPAGEILFQAHDREVTQTQVLEKTELKRVRRRLPFLADRDHFDINLKEN